MEDRGAGEGGLVDRCVITARRGRDLPKANREESGERRELTNYESFSTGGGGDDWQVKHVAFMPPPPAILGIIEGWDSCQSSSAHCCLWGLLFL